MGVGILHEYFYEDPISVYMVFHLMKIEVSGCFYNNKLCVAAGT